MLLPIDMKFAARKVHFLQNEGPKFELVGSFTVPLPCVHSGLYSRFQNWSIAGSVRNKIQIVPGELDMNLPAAFFRQSLSPWTMWNAKYCSPHLVSTRIGREKTLVWTLTVLISKKSPPQCHLTPALPSQRWVQDPGCFNRRLWLSSHKYRGKKEM